MCRDRKRNVGGDHLLAAMRRSLRQETFHPLADSIWCKAVRFRNFFAGVSVEFDLHEEIDFVVGKKSIPHAAVEKMPQQSVALYQVVIQGCARLLAILLFLPGHARFPLGRPMRKAAV